MAVKLILTTTKPEGVEWWWELYPAKQTKIDEYMRSLNGFLDYTSTRPSANTRVQTLTFQTKEDLSVWQKNLLPESSERVERVKYNADNQILTTVIVETV
jgi:hypothetical protein